MNNLKNQQIINTNQTQENNLVTQSDVFSQKEFLRKQSRSNILQIPESYQEIEQKKQSQDNIMKQKVDQALKKCALNNIFSRLKIRQVIYNKVNTLPTRMFKSLSDKHYQLINDKSIINKQENNQQQQQKRVIKELPLARKFSLDIIDTEMEEKDEIQEESSFSQFLVWLIKLFNLIPIIKPSSIFKKSWDIFFIIIEIIMIIFIPFHIIFGFSFQFLLGKELASILPFVFICDVIINLSTDYFEKGELVQNRQKILANYYKSSLLYDVISFTPITVQMFYELNDFSQQGNSDETWWNILLIFFIVRIRTIMKTINKFQETYSFETKTGHLINLAKLFGFIALMGHLFASIWLFIAIREQQSNKNSWIKVLNYTEEEWYVQYLYSYYFAIVTMITIGFGDISPKTPIEALLCIILMLFSCGFFAYNINTVDHIFQEMFKKESKIKQNFTIFNKFMRKKNISNDLQCRVREYLDYIWNESSEDQHVEQQIIQQLSDVLKEKILIEANKIVLRDSPLFRNNFSEIVISKTVPLIKEYKCTPGEIIFLQNKIDDCSIYFIDKGSVEIFMDQKIIGQQESVQHSSLQILQQGEYFGSESFFTGMERQYSLKSNEFTNLLVIKRQEFLKLIQQFPEDYEKFILIKDSIANLKDFGKANLKCYSCFAINHQLQDCPYLHFNQSINKILIKQNFNITQDRQKIDTRKDYKFQTKKQILSTLKDFEQFQATHELIIDDYIVKNNLEIDDYYDGATTTNQDDGSQDGKNYEKLYQIQEDQQEVDSIQSSTSSESDTYRSVSCFTKKSNYEIQQQNQSQLNRQSTFIFKDSPQEKAQLNKQKSLQQNYVLPSPKQQNNQISSANSINDNQQLQFKQNQTQAKKYGVINKQIFTINEEEIDCFQNKCNQQDQNFYDIVLMDLDQELPQIKIYTPEEVDQQIKVRDQLLTIQLEEEKENRKIALQQQQTQKNISYSQTQMFNFNQAFNNTIEENNNNNKDSQNNTPLQKQINYTNSIHQPNEQDHKAQQLKKQSSVCIKSPHNKKFSYQDQNLRLNRLASINCYENKPQSIGSPHQSKQKQRSTNSRPSQFINDYNQKQTVEILNNEKHKQSIINNLERNPSMLRTVHRGSILDLQSHPLVNNLKKNPQITRSSNVAIKEVLEQILQSTQPQQNFSTDNNKDFDLQKSYQFYFPHNNLEIVLDSYKKLQKQKLQISKGLPITKQRLKLRVQTIKQQQFQKQLQDKKLNRYFVKEDIDGQSRSQHSLSRIKSQSLTVLMSKQDDLDSNQMQNSISQINLLKSNYIAAKKEEPNESKIDQQKKQVKFFTRKEL